MRLALAVLVSCLVCFGTYGEEPVPEGGSPMCVWQITVMLVAYAETCGLDRQEEYYSVIVDSDRRIQAFIVGNSKTSAETMALIRAQIVQDVAERRHDIQATSGTDICDPTSEDSLAAMYRHASTYRSPAAERAWVDRFVSVPRSPWQGGCL